MTDEERAWCTKTMLTTTHYDIMRGQAVTLHRGSSDPNPPRLVDGVFRWADGSPDSGLIDWGDEGLREAPGGKGNR